jgi:hypothetical protein
MYPIEQIENLNPIVNAKENSVILFGHYFMSIILSLAATFQEKP